MNDMKRIKWIKNDVSFGRGNFRPLIAHLDDSPFWLEFCACMAAQTFKEDVRRLAQAFGCATIEVKYHWDENGEATEPEDSIVGVLSFGGGEYLFRQELPVPEGAKRKFHEFSGEQIFSYCA